MTQQTNNTLTSEQREIIGRAISGHFIGQYWAQRAVARIYEQTNVTLAIREDKYAPAICTLHYTN